VAASVLGELVPLPLGLPMLQSMMRTGGLSADRAGSLAADLVEDYGPGARIGIRELGRRYPGLAHWAIRYVYRGYTEKHWGMPLEDVPPSVIARLPFVVGEQKSYFTDKYQAVPVNGYTAIIERMLDHPKITVECGVTGSVDVLALMAEHTVIWTGSLDDFFGEEGALPYRSVHFDVSKRGLRGGWESFHTVTNPEHDGPTRATNMALMNGREDSADAMIVTDYPYAYVPGKNDPLYPIPSEANILQAQSYGARRPKNVWFAGRLGSYQYLNMDQAIAQALALFDRIRTA